MYPDSGLPPMPGEMPYQLPFVAAERRARSLLLLAVAINTAAIPVALASTLGLAALPVLGLLGLGIATVLLYVATAINLAAARIVKSAR